MTDPLSLEALVASFHDMRVRTEQLMAKEAELAWGQHQLGDFTVLLLPRRKWCNQHGAGCFSVRSELRMHAGGIDYAVWRPSCGRGKLTGSLKREVERLLGFSLRYDYGFGAFVTPLSTLRDMIILQDRRRPPICRICGSPAARWDLNEFVRMVLTHEQKEVVGFRFCSIKCKESFQWHEARQRHTQLRKIISRPDLWPSLREEFAARQTSRSS